MTKDPVAGLRAIFERPGPRMVTTGVPVRFPRRYQRSDRDTAVYNAQNDAIETVPHRVLHGQVEIQAYVDEVLSMPWPRWLTGPAWPVVVAVVPGLTAATGTALYRNGTIYVPAAVEEILVLHELGHYLSPVATGRHGTLNPEHHGPFWVAALLDLVEHVMNPAAASLFRGCLAAEGVST